MFRVPALDMRVLHAVAVLGALASVLRALDVRVPLAVQALGTLCEVLAGDSLELSESVLGSSLTTLPLKRKLVNPLVFRAQRALL